MGDEDDWNKLPSEQKVAHKVWKARLAGYTELVKHFNTLEDKSPDFQKYGHFLKGFIGDSNAAAQEKGMEAAVAYLNNAPQGIVSKCSQEIVAAAVNKGLGATRPKTKELAQEIVMLIVEREKQELVMEELIGALSNKQPKFVATCALVIRDALKYFGPKLIGIKLILKNVPRLLEDRDKNVREAGKQIIIEMAIWVGRAAIKPNLQTLKPVQLQELDAEFDKIESEQVRRVPTRFTLAEQKKRMAAGFSGDAVDAAGPVVASTVGAAVSVEAPVVDAWELAEPQEIISKFPSNWRDLLESKKWQERKEALEPIEKLASAIRLKSGEYGDLCHALINVIKKDANVVVVQLAAKVVTGLGKGLRRSYSAYAHASLTALLDRSKEKKQNVLQALREACDAVFLATNLDAMSEHAIPYLSNKTPGVRSETTNFLIRCFTASRGPKLFGSKKIVKLYVGPLLTLAGDQVGDVREAAFECLGCLHAFAGEKVVEPFLADVDSIRSTKIHEVSQKKLASFSGQSAPAPEPVAEPPKPSITGGGGRKPSAPPKSSYDDAADSAPVPAIKKTVKSAPAGGRKTAAKGSAKPKLAEESEMSEEAAIFECTNLFGEETIKLLQSSAWKERQQALEQMLSTLKSMSAESIPIQAVIRTMAAKSGLRDNNLPVMKMKIDLLSFLASEQVAPKFSRTSAYGCLNELVDKMGDAKFTAAIQKLLSNLAEFSPSLAPEFLVPYVLSQSLSAKSPKTHQEALNWTATVINDFGLRFSLKEVVPQIRIALGSANGQVRTAAISVFGRLYLLTGSTLRTLLEDEKPALLQLIDAEFERVKDTEVPRPTRGVKPQADSVEDEEGDAGESSSGNVAEAALEDLLPRVDISSKLQGDLMDQLDDKSSYKLRKEAIDRVLEIIKEAKLIQPNLGDLPPILVKRMKEANKVLVQSGLGVCEQLAISLGKKGIDHISVLCPAILNCFGDSKPQIRQQASQCLGVWVEQCGRGLTPFLDNFLFSTAFQTGNTNVKSELLQWLKKQLPSTPCRLPKEDLIASIPFVLSALEDRSGEVRKAAQEITLPVMIHTGFEPFNRAVSALKPASKDQLTPLIEKARAELPPPPAKQALSKQATMVKKPAKPPVESRVSPTERKGSSPPKAVARSSPLKGNRAASASALNGSPSQSMAVSSKQQPVEEETSPLFDEKSTPAVKDARAREELKLKFLKWNFSQPSKEYVDQLKRQMSTANISSLLLELLFSTDVRQQIRAIDQIAAYGERKPLIVFSNIDLIFKWLTLRFFENNTTLHIRCFRFLIGLLPAFGATKLRLSDSDVACFMPYLLVKVGDSKDNIRRDVHTIIRVMCEVYPVHKLVPWIIEGFKSRNAKQRAECLEQLQTFFNDFDLATAGCDQATMISILRSIAGQVADRDGSVRNAALTCLVAGATRQGFGAEGILQNTASVMQPKERAMLEERLRRACPFEPAESTSTSSSSRSGRGQGTPSLSGSATLTRPARAVATPNLGGDPMVSRGSGVISTPSNGIAANAGTKTITRNRSSSTTRPAPRVSYAQVPPPSSSVEPVDSPEESSDESDASPSPVRVESAPKIQPPKPSDRFKDPAGQNWAAPELPPEIPPFVLAEDFLKEPPVQMPYRSVDPNTLPASTGMVPQILARLNSAGVSVSSSDVLTPLIHLSLTAANRRINLEPHCDVVVSTLTSLIRRVCDAISPGSVPDLYRTEANYYKVLATLCSHLRDLHTKLFQTDSPFAKKISLRILRDHLSLLTNQISAFNVHLTTALEKNQGKSDILESSPYESHLEAQKNLLHSLIDILKSVVRSANAGTLLVVLIELLQESVQKQSVTGDSPVNAGVKQLVLKAIWNITRHIEERHGEIYDSASNWEAIIGASHRFFVAFPPQFWQNQDSTPARTVRTVFNAAIAHLGLGKHILSSYEKAFPDNYSESALYSWLLNCYQKHNANAMNGSGASSRNANSASSQKENGVSVTPSTTAVAGEFSQIKLN